MYMFERPPWQRGTCTKCNRTMNPVVRCMSFGCTTKSCVDCDDVHACKECQLPVCSQCRETHKPPKCGIDAAIPTCRVCAIAKVDWGIRMCCESCKMPPCTNRACSTSLRTTNCICLMDVCGTCSQMCRAVPEHGVARIICLCNRCLVCLPVSVDLPSTLAGG